MNPMDRHFFFASLLACLGTWVSFPLVVLAQDEAAETAGVGAEKLWQSHIRNRPVKYILALLVA